MRSASDVADWWDENKAESEKILTEWVQDNPQWWKVALAATLGTAMDVGAGTVDVLRFGQGAAEGGVTGIGQDVLRLLVLLGPLGRVGGTVSRLAHLRRLRIAVRVSGVDGPCTFQAANNAMSIMKGKSLFITLDDMVGAVGRRIEDLKEIKAADGTFLKYKLGAWVDELVPAMRNAGAKVKEVRNLTTVEQAAGLAQKESGVVIFAFRTKVLAQDLEKLKQGVHATVEQDILHSVIAVRDAMGRVRYADYGGRFFNSLPELARRWGQPVAPFSLIQDGVSAAVLQGMGLTGQLAVKLAKGAIIVIDGFTAIETVENAVEFAAPVAVIATPEPVKDDPATMDVVKGSFDAFKSRKNGKKVIKLPDLVISAGRRTAPRSDWLTGVQFRLNALGYGSGKVDGAMGPVTRRAVTAFQRDYPPLAADGIPGSKTQAKLVAVCGY